MLKDDDLSQIVISTVDDMETKILSIQRKFNSLTQRHQGSSLENKDK